jgi:hypothetical protein
MQTVTVDQKRPLDAAYSAQLCEHLERGDVVVLDPTPYLPPESDLAALRNQKQTNSAIHKNIAYKPDRNKVTGAGEADVERLHQVMADFSKGSLAYLARLFAPYAKAWKVDYASFRPFQEKGRKLSISHRNDLMHVDAFPTRPTHGGRILRAFTNIHPSVDRVWVMSDDFDHVASQYAQDAGLMEVLGPLAGAKRAAASLGRFIGIKAPKRSPYDDFMVRFHDYLKRSEPFQRDGRTHRVAFHPGQTWISFTDAVSHAVESGQYAVEQTCIVPFSAMLKPELAPISVLERMAGRPLAAERR